MFNLKRSSTKLTCHVKAKGLSSKRPAEPGPTDRQERIPHFNQALIQKAKIGLIGAGGINSEIGQGLARKGYGTIRIWDDDSVSLSNYSRQYFFPRDLYQKKALCLPRNLAKNCVYPTTITGYAMRFEEAVAAGMAMDCDVYVFGVDNNATRAFGCYTLYTTAPVVFLGTGPQANNGYVFIQEHGKTCFICLRPDALTDTTQLSCAPSSIDILKAIAGIALYAIDSLVIGRPRHWNYREVFLAGAIADRTLSQNRWAECPVCSNG